MQDNVKLLVCGDVEAPRRKFGDAGIDFFVPDGTQKFIDDLKACNEKDFGSGVVVDLLGINVAPGCDVKIPLYVKSRIRPDMALLAVNKSGIATKQKLTVGAQLIDSSYQGIIHAHMINFSNDHQEIFFGQKIVQFIPVKIDAEELDIKTTGEISDEEFYEGHDSERGEGGFGSSGLV